MFKERALCETCRSEIELPPIHAGHATAQIHHRVETFYRSVAEIFETWVKRRVSEHTRRACRQDVMAFANFMRLKWPAQAPSLLTVSVADVHFYRDNLTELGAAPKTFNRRISSLLSFYQYLGAAAAELRLPITVPNLAHSQFIPRSSSDPREETRALSATRARQLRGLPDGDNLIAYRDRAILEFYLYT